MPKGEYEGLGAGAGGDEAMMPVVRSDRAASMNRELLASAPGEHEVVPSSLDFQKCCRFCLEHRSLSRLCLAVC